MHPAIKIQILDQVSELLTQAENLLLSVGMKDTSLKLARVYNEDIDPERDYQFERLINSGALVEKRKVTL